LVSEILSACEANSDESVDFDGRTLSLYEWLISHCDICRPSNELLAAVAKALPGSPLSTLLHPDRSTDLKNWLLGRDVLDLLNLLPTPLAAEQLIPLLRKLAPRLYSISSSPKAHPAEVHLTISTVRYVSHDRPRKGVASCFLADRCIDKSVGVYIQTSLGFKLPSNSDAHIIMVGPGTGIAPFRAFLEERESTAAKGKNWLFFGDQRRTTDFLYEDQISQWHQRGHLNRLDLAFSRDQSEKIYVQDRILENASELWAWLEEGAHFYVCGDASRMAADVDRALHKVIEIAGGKKPGEASAYIQKLKSEKRYQRDVY
jgi:sulfite reductase (NADPH) flavoprotein alpha-component